MVEKVKAAWAAAGRDGEPRMMGLAYSAAKDAETVKQYLAAYEDAGCDELILFPCSSDPDQVDRLADAVGL